MSVKSLLGHKLEVSVDKYETLNFLSTNCKTTRRKSPETLENNIERQSLKLKLRAQLWKEKNRTLDEHCLSSPQFNQVKSDASTEHATESEPGPLRRMAPALCGWADFARNTR